MGRQTFLYGLESIGFLYESEAKSVPAVLVFVPYLELLLWPALRSYDLQRFRLKKKRVCVWLVTECKGKCCGDLRARFLELDVWRLFYK